MLSLLLFVIIRKYKIYGDFFSLLVKPYFPYCVAGVRGEQKKIVPWLHMLEDKLRRKIAIESVR